MTLNHHYDFDASVSRLVLRGWRRSELALANLFTFGAR
jgi:hypothetical protein